MSEMTLSQAIRRMAKLKAEVTAWRSRALSSVTHKKGDSPAYNFDEALQSADDRSHELIVLKSRIASTNARVFVSGREGLLLVEALNQLNEWKGQIEWLKTLPVKHRMTVSEETKEYDTELEKYVSKTVVWMCDLPEADRDEKIAELQAKFDELNDAVEVTNAKTLLV